jgi:hypothetical protein
VGGCGRVCGFFVGALGGLIEDGSGSVGGVLGEDGRERERERTLVVEGGGGFPPKDGY